MLLLVKLKSHTPSFDQPNMGMNSMVVISMAILFFVMGVLRK